MNFIERLKFFRGLILSVLLGAACLSVSGPAIAEETTSGDLSGDVFSFRVLRDMAEELASSDFEDPEGVVPGFLLDLSYDDWRKTRFRLEESLWRGDNLPFEVQFFHPGLFYNRFVRVNVVDGGRVEPVAFSSDMFEYGDSSLADRVAAVSMDFAGFRVHHHLNKDDYKDEVAVFLGASYFRAVAKGVQYGLSARGLAVDTALQSGEEFPYFREFWLDRPKASDDVMTVYALLDSPGMTGAYRFVIDPGEITELDVSCDLFLRRDVAKLGIAPLTSMFLYGENDNGRPGDFRPEVHDSDGLLTCDSEGKWLWRPLSNPRRLSLSSVEMADPVGFGLIQRDADFDHYQDLEARYERRPSLWIEPAEGWGKGRVELVEIPTNSEIHDNVVAYWIPDKMKAPEGEVPTYPKKLSFSYRMGWMAPGEAVHPLGRVAATRMADGGDPKTVRFVVDFEGGLLDDVPEDGPLSSIVYVGEGAKLVDKQLVKNDVTGGWRLSFRVTSGVDESLRALFPSMGNRPVIELSALLKKGENLTDPLTETWTYEWRP
ncbi:periplasmic glucan biosynthesis protein MdoG [Dethiosulfovibrio peptidovorans DSM 11002]|uniref:Glucans biosynthesis protein G n=1 Tax=Dethiosulfovibrio peptidovorans DSM 11002 TaxID=469381 RepID=D2Z635_9BACT|nr:glucan biosynthesis protein G [Dethiosulfovibrio peptidovorans]EFC90932.1 periplasmic glucan biosynthesis protein MdoG [Dethiosulfovibrio peptidovorans DSM 11002]